MFLRRNRRIVDGESYEYWTLVKTVRTAKGPRQEIVATLGKEPGLESRSRHGWEDVADLLEGRAPARRRASWASRWRGAAGAVGAGRSAGSAGGTGAGFRASLSGAVAVAALGLAHVLAADSSRRARGSALGADGLHSDAGAVLRAEERTGSGRALVCRQRVGGSAGRALLSSQRRAAVSRPGCVARAQGSSCAGICWNATRACLG